jgi:hypothetical protein
MQGYWVLKYVIYLPLCFKDKDKISWCNNALIRISEKF